ncbi:hypothetical protein VTG60DRAFT_1535 [Thermothelomyces hinnuleus]
MSCAITKTSRAIFLLAPPLLGFFGLFFSTSMDLSLRPHAWLNSSPITSTDSSPHRPMYSVVFPTTFHPPSGTPIYSSSLSSRAMGSSDERTVLA